jgi:hypothetical protein
MRYVACAPLASSALLAAHIARVVVVDTRQLVESGLGLVETL